MSLEGDFAELDKAIRQLEQLAGAEQRIARRAVAKIERVARAQWAAGKGPSGRPWPRTKDGRVPLVALTERIKFRAAGGKIVASGPDELRPHFRERPVFPAPGEPLPAPWQAALEEAAAEELGERGRP